MDAFIVVISLVALGFQELPGVKVIRVFRAFRVVRIFKRLRSLRLIVIAFGASMKPGLLSRIEMAWHALCRASNRLVKRERWAMPTDVMWDERT
eukprot:1859503-Rhodomonas_salina.2